jgi:hypothetical protein
MMELLRKIYLPLLLLWSSLSWLDAFPILPPHHQQQSSSPSISKTSLFSSTLHPAVQGWPEKYKEAAGSNLPDKNSDDDPTSHPRGPRVLHDVFTVEPASEYTLYQLDVRNWPTWTTSDKEKWAVGNQNLDKVMPYGELSYVLKGKLEIIPLEGEMLGQTILVQEGDFVTFPFEFKAHWRVLEELTWHYYLY